MTTQERNRRYYLNNRERLIKKEAERRKLPDYLEKSREYYRKHRDSKLAQKKVYHAANHEKRAQYAKRYYRDKIDRFKAYRKTYRRDNLDKVLERNRIYIANNSEKVAKWKSAYRLKNRVKIRQYDSRRRAREVSATIDKEATNHFYKCLDNQDVLTCSYCGVLITEKTFHVDHIIPIVKLGAHDANNLCVSCVRCNQSKKDALLAEWRHCPDRVKPLIPLICD